MPTDAYDALADSGTRLIAVSAVHSPTGDRADLGAIGRIAQRSGAGFFVDACQAAGAIELDVRRDAIDFLAAASHKFLLGSRGMGYLFVRRELVELLRPVGPGWKAGRKPFESFYGPAMELSTSASKLDSSLAWFAALAEVASLGIIEEIGLAAILERNAQLSRHLHQVLIERVPAFEPLPPERRTTIVSIPVADSDATMARLRADDIVATVRAGRIRLSAHCYNLESEIDRAVERLADAQRRS